MNDNSKHPFDLGLVIDLHQALHYHLSPSLLPCASVESSVGLQAFSSLSFSESAPTANLSFIDRLFGHNESYKRELSIVEGRSPSKKSFHQSSYHAVSTSKVPKAVHWSQVHMQHRRGSVAAPHRNYEEEYDVSDPTTDKSMAPGDHRKEIYLQQLFTDFPLEAPLLLHAQGRHSNSAYRTLYAPTVHVFVDHSNILIGYLNTMQSNDGSTGRILPLSFDQLSIILERGRRLAKRVLVGSSRRSPSVRQAESLGYETCILERITKPETDYTSSSDHTIPLMGGVKKKREQMVDELLQMKMLESLLDYPPSTIVLATGDAATAEYSPGFSAVVRRAVNLGWVVELIAFKASISRIWRKNHGWGRNFRIITLDPYIKGLMS